MSKWIKVDPATLKVGDEVRMVDAFSMFQISGKTSPSKIGICVGGIDFTEAPECRTWFVRKPKKAKPEPDLVEGHDAKFWFGRWEKQLNHNEQLQAEKNTELANLRKVLAQAQNSNSPSNVNPLAAFYRPYRTRPDEPPVGTFFRVDRTGFEFWRFASMEDGYGYWQISPRSEEPDWERWDDITEPGDTITRLYLREVPND